MSVLDVIKAFNRHSNVPINFKYTKNRKGDIGISFCSPKKALKELNWKSKISIDEAIKSISKII